jgi:membrane-associated phospholipid phosphatase
LASPWDPSSSIKNSIPTDDAGQEFVLASAIKKFLTGDRACFVIFMITAAAMKTKNSILLFFTSVLSVTIVAQPDSSIQFSSKQKFSYSYQDHKKFLSPKSLVIPTAFIAYGFTTLKAQPLKAVNLGIRNEIAGSKRSFHTSIDDYLKYAPVATVYLLDLAGLKSKHNFVDRTIILVVANTISNQLVTKLKHATNQLRPDGSTYNSFPSGHTTTAFIGAEFMNQEYGCRSPWYSLVGYGLASITGGLRVMNNRHWLSDVLAGAGLGIISTKLTYWAYYELKPKLTTKKTFY